MSSRETAPNFTTQPDRIFPLDGRSIEACVTMFTGQDDARLRLIRQSNLAALPADDPVRYVLQFGARPSIGAAFRRDEPVAEAYLTGACIAAAMSNVKLDALSDEGVSTTGSFDPQAAPIMEHPKARHRLPFLGRGDWLDSLAHMDDVFGLNTYFMSDDLIERIGELKATWMLNWSRNKIGFMGNEPIRQGVADYLTLGMSDAFAMIALAYGEVPQAQKVTHRGYDRRNHILRSPDTRSDEELATARSYVGVPRLATKIKTAKHAPGFIHDPVTRTFYSQREWLWQQEVPHQAKVTHISTFAAMDILEAPGRTDSVVEVGLKDTFHEYKLTERDVLLCRGTRSGEVVPFVFPFENTTDAVGRAHGGLELLALCRRGEAIPLAELSQLEPDKSEELFAWIEYVTWNQNGPKERLLGSIAVHPNTWLVSVPLAAAAAYTYKYGEYRPMVDIPLWNAVGGLLTFAYLRGRKHVRQYADSSNTPRHHLLEEEDEVTTPEAADH